MNFLKKHRNDLLLILALLLAAGAIGAYLLATRSEGGYVRVTVDGEEIMTLPLSKNTSMELGDGEHTNLLVIENGAARIEQASCPDKLCINQGEICYDGQLIVCLPNKLVVTVIDGPKSNSDAVSQ